MIDQADERMLEWARKIVPDVPVAIAAPPASDSDAGVGINLLSIAPVPAARGAKRPPLELALYYLVTTIAADEAEAHRWLGALAFDAMEVREWTISSEPLDAEVFRAFGVAPRPALVVRVPLRLERNDAEAPLVRRPLVLRTASTTDLAGIVTGPDDIPIANATLEIPELQLRTRTDDRGTFRFAQIPASSSIELVVRAKRHVRTVRAQGGEPLHIRFENLEG
jgi:hypothetical protein